MKPKNPLVVMLLVNAVGAVVSTLAGLLIALKLKKPEVEKVPMGFHPPQEK